MRRVLLCCALICVAATACSSSSATPTAWNPPNQQYAPATPAAQASAAQQWPQATPYPWQTPAAGQTPYPWETPPAQVPVPPVIFPSLGTNPYVDTMTDHLSTFGLDVDTASYTVARKYIASGARPDPASVRPEEWVNYFDQGYAGPESGAFAIHADGGPTPFLSQNEVLVRIGVKAHDVSANQRPSAALTFVVDVSGSMADGGRLELVKQSLALLVAQLRGDDSVGIVAFSDTASVDPDSHLGREPTNDPVRDRQAQANEQHQRRGRAPARLRHGPTAVQAERPQPRRARHGRRSEYR